MLSYSILYGQSRNDNLKELQRIKTSESFDPESKIYIDQLILIGQDSYLYKPDSTKLYINEAYELSKKLNYFRGESRSLSILGNYYTDNGNLEKAYELLHKSLSIANKHNLQFEKIIAFNLLGLVQWQEGKNGLALTNYLKALTIAEEVEDFYMMGSLNDNIALLYEDYKDYETALAHIKKSREISLTNNFKVSATQSLLNMSEIYRKQKKYALANESVDKCIDLFKEENVSDWLSYAYDVKGSIALEQHQYKVALSWFEKVLKILKKGDLSLGYTSTYSGMAEAYLSLSNMEMAEFYGLKSLKVSEDLKNFENIKKSNAVLAKIYNEKGDYFKAYEYQSNYIELFEKTTTENYQKGFGVIKSKIEFENQKIKLIEESKTAIARQKQYIVIAMIVIIVLALFLLLIHRNQKLQKKFNTQLQEKQVILVKRESELQEANETKDKLFSVIAHDLRGPINSFHTLIKLYVDKGLSTVEIESVLPKALQNINGILDMLNNLLVWAKTQMNGSTIKPKNLNVGTLVNENIELLTPIAEKKFITLTSNLPTDIISFSDRDHLDIVLRNLLSNGIKFTKLNGKVVVNSKMLGHKYVIMVTDTGVGMSNEAQAKIFNINSTKSTYGTNMEKGTGLGLSLSKEMIESNGGEIWVESKIGHGTTIFFTIPLKSQNNSCV